MVCIAVMGPSEQSEAIVLRTRAYGESDKIVTLLTAAVGKLTGIAKGAKNSRRRFANCLDPFTRVHLHYRTRAGASLAFMDSCDLLDPPGVLSEPMKFAYGSYLLELVDQLTIEGQPVPDLYGLLADALDTLRGGPATAGFLRVFELRLLYHTGYAPQLRACGRCRAPLQGAERAFLDPAHADVVCVRCSATGTNAALLPVAGPTLLALDGLRNVPLRDARSRTLSGTAAGDAAQFMGRLLAAHLPRPLRSVKLIAALTSTPAVG